MVRALPDQPLLDRLVRGRSWIPVLGVLLAGIVAMQVEVLKLGASIGRSINAGTALQSRNQLLRASVAGLADQQRIERLAAGMGMVMPLPGEVGFLAAPSGADAVHAANDIHAPDATSFLAALTASATNLTSGPAGQTAAAVPTPPGTATAASAAATSPTSAAQTQPAPTSQTGGAGQPTATGAVSPTVGGSAGSSSAASPAQTPVTPASGAPVQPAPPAQRTSSGGATPAGG